MDEAGEVRGSSVIACGEAPEVFEPAEAALDPIALLVDVDVVRNDDLAGSVGRDDRCCPHIGDDRAQRVAVIGLVGKHGFADLVVEQGRRLGDVASLSGCDDESERATKCIGQHMDLRGQPTSGTPQRLIFGPPFPLAACW